ncbi:hypothetical protein [Aneurinibacillus migulanus]|nr:hypothetical protein [Aneurinibacillus migulanus]
MDFKDGDIVVDLSRNGNPLGKPYAITSDGIYYTGRNKKSQSK